MPLKKTAPILILPALLVPAIYLGAQEPEEVERTLQEEMRALNVTMEQIAALLEKHVQTQESDLLIKRIELTNRTLVSDREQLRKARTSMANLEEEASHVSRMLESWEEEFSSSGREELDVAERLSLDQMEHQLKALDGRRRDLEREIVELENTVLTQEEDMRILKDVLDERLGLR